MGSIQLFLEGKLVDEIEDGVDSPDNANVDTIRETIQNASTIGEVKSALLDVLNIVTPMN